MCQKAIELLSVAFPEAFQVIEKPPRLFVAMFTVTIRGERPHLTSIETL